MTARCDDAENLGEAFWAHMAQLGKFDTPGECRAMALRSMYIGVGYFQREGFQMLETQPLIWTQGDLAGNVATLSVAADGELDHVSLQLKRCCKHYGKQYVQQCLSLLRDSSCTIQLVEKAHSAGAKTMRMHKLYGTQILTARSSVVHFNQLWQPTDTREARLQRQIEVTSPGPLGGWSRYPPPLRTRAFMPSPATVKNGH